MHGAAFTPLFDGPLSSVMVWERAHRCPCTTSDGSADTACRVCFGKGRYWEPPSAPFRGALVTLSARALSALFQRFGPGVTGDATVSVLGDAPCWSAMGEGDRFTALRAVDAVEWSLAAGDRIRLPYGADGITALVRSHDRAGVVPVAPPTPGPDGRISVSVPTVLAFSAPRRYEVVRDLSQVRAFGTGPVGLPKKALVKMLDWSER